MSEMTDALMRLADSIDATGDGVEGWETSAAHAWAEQVRDAAELDPYAGTPCGRHLGAVARYIAMLEAMGRKHGAELEGLRAERDALRDGLARMGGQTHGYPTEGELSPEMRARLMPEGMEWPRFEDGEPVMIGDDFRTPTSSGLTESVLGVEFAENVWNGGGYQVNIWPDNRDDHLEDNTHYVFDPGERVKRPEPPETESRECRDSDAPDSWERIEDDATCPPAMYCRAHGLELPPDPDESDYDSAWAKDLLRRAQALMAATAGPDVVRPGEVV